MQIRSRTSSSELSQFIEKLTPYSYHIYRASKWSHPSSGLKIVPIVTANETFSPGDAMRDIYTHGVISGDFVLVTGDLVSNVRIDEIIRVHKERRKADPNAIMTMVVKESGVRHRTR
jgi:translation initiation factor eIF-2B subunit epsilon